MSNDSVFAHPRGEFQLKIKRREADQLCQALLRSQDSYITLEIDGLNAEGCGIALRFVALCDKMTNGLITLPQARREETRRELGEIHTELLRRGCHVLAGRLELARVHGPRDETGVVWHQWTELIEITAAVVTNTAISEATMLMPHGRIAPQDDGYIEPTRELSWCD